MSPVLKLSALAIAVLSAGCAQYQWRKAGATQAEFNQDSYACQMEAARAFPTQVVQQQLASGYTTPSTTNCYGSGSAYGSGNMVFGNTNTNCTTMPGRYVPPVTYTSDVNEDNRKNAAMSCMFARGYERVRVK